MTIGTAATGTATTEKTVVGNAEVGTPHAEAVIDLDAIAHKSPNEIKTVIEFGPAS